MKVIKKLMLCLILLAAAGVLLTGCGGSQVTEDSIKGTWIVDSAYNSFETAGIHYRVVFEDDGKFLIEKYPSTNASEPDASRRGTYSIESSDGGSRITLKVTSGGGAFSDIPDGTYDAELSGSKLTLSGDDNISIIFVKMD